MEQTRHSMATNKYIAIHVYYAINDIADAKMA
jgi:hypothetical protein